MTHWRFQAAILLPPPASLLPETSISASQTTKRPSASVLETCFSTHQAGSFFQNNNSVLVPLTSYVRDAIFPSTAESASSTLPPTHLVDAYCGAGLFALTLAPNFTQVAGIELSADSIRFATHNAELNGLAHKVSFRAGDAAQIFSAVADFPPDRTALVVDPPRKGCDEAFIRQLLGFRAQTIVYVSCNVHTQARDVGQIVSWSAEERWWRGRERESTC